MEQRKCPICDSNIICKIKRAELYFYIDKEGFVRMDNNPDLFEYDPIQFQCESSPDHNIEIEKEWKEEFREKIYRLI